MPNEIFFSFAHDKKTAHIKDLIDEKLVDSEINSLLVDNLYAANKDIIFNIDDYETFIVNEHLSSGRQSNLMHIDYVTLKVLMEFNKVNKIKENMIHLKNDQCHKLSIQYNKKMNMPTIGFGTYRLKTVYQSVLAALKIGYRHIDTAALYNNTKEIGKAIRDSGIPRKDIFITTKVKCGRQRSKINTSIIKQLEELGTSYVDLLLLHHADPGFDVANWKKLEALYKNGICLHIGVSNFSVSSLNTLMESAHVIPSVNQIEVSPFNTNEYIISQCKKHGIKIMAYSSLTKGNKFGDEKLRKMADYNKMSVPEILLKWAIQRKYYVIPCSGDIKHIEDNFRIAYNGTEINETDMESLNTIYNENYMTHPKAVIV